MTIHEIRPKTPPAEQRVVATIEAATRETSATTATIRQIADHPDPGHGMAMVGVVQALVDRASMRATELEALLDRIAEAGTTVTPALTRLKGVCGPPFVQAVVRAKAVLRGQVQVDDLFASWYPKSIALFEAVQHALHVLDRAK